MDNDEDVLTFDLPLDRFQYLKKKPRDPFDVIPLHKVAAIVTKEIVLVESVSELGGMSRYRIKKKIDIPSLRELEDIGQLNEQILAHKPEPHNALKIERLSTNEEAIRAQNSSEGEKVEDDIKDFTFHRSSPEIQRVHPMLNVAKLTDDRAHES